MCAEDWHFQHTYMHDNIVSYSTCFVEVISDKMHKRNITMCRYCAFFLISAVTVTVRWRISGSNSETVI